MAIVLRKLLPGYRLNLADDLNYNFQLLLDNLGSGGGGGTPAYTDASFAATGNNQATAALTTADLNTITSVPTGSGVLLVGGTQAPWVIRRIIINRGTQTLLIYPPVGQAIETAGINNPVSILAGGAATFKQTSGSLWRAF